MYGSPRLEPSMSLPEICLQSLAVDDSWWQEHKDQKIVRGALIHAFVPHVDQTPFTLEPIGRDDPRGHDSAVARVSALRVDAPLKRTELPVAAMVLNGNEVWGAYRAKRRPCVVVSCAGVPVDAALTRGKPNRSTAPTFLVAPYFGIAAGEGRAGYSPEFVDRVQRCEYPQFIWDTLPHPGGEASILRIDQLQPIGAHYMAYKCLGFRLSQSALEIVDEHLTWLLQGGVPQDGIVNAYRGAIS